MEAEREAQKAEEQRDAMARHWLAERRVQRDQAEREAGVPSRESWHPKLARARPGSLATGEAQPRGGTVAHRRTVSAGPKCGFGGRPYKPQSVGWKTRRPGELISPRLRRRGLEWGLSTLR